MSTKTALIWGANGGIGRALISQLKHQGWQVIAISRDETTIDDLDPDLNLEISAISDT